MCYIIRVRKAKERKMIKQFEVGKTYGQAYKNLGNNTVTIEKRTKCFVWLWSDMKCKIRIENETELISPPIGMITHTYSASNIVN